ncbi:MAG TPA: GNAT family N-acetyltransferase [Hyphomicrobium sp.]|jgi:GNAT superfamily N-acetyltransferase|uniref:GNAT family N-acetyltransferase n=1 Tax=Hyphomicrobium sp. TaxID=82 RepID=UPI002C0C40C0|nr:GNAT family N-acetyltransferase [Hyphomicrobium sp.]HXE02297.1 GNAT family N-acetyltransferase [Hyphomicrobium sp.]
MKISVRPVEATDEGPWLALFRDYITFYEATVPEDVIALTWQRLLSRADNMMALVAADEAGRALGIAALVFHRSTWSPAWYCYLEDLFVAPAARGRGIGRALIEATYAEADRRGASRTYWATQEKNETARTLYDRLGQLTDFVQYRR